MKKVYMLLMVFTLFVLGGRQIYGCFLYIEPEEVIKEADVIMLVRVIGEKGMVNEEHVTGRGAGTYGDTQWHVEVYQVLKDVTGGKEIKIATEGAKEATIHMSTDFTLEEFGEYMILCLDEKANGYFYPATPSSIIPLKTIDKDNLEATLNLDNINLETVDAKEYHKFLEALNKHCIQKGENEPTFLFQVEGSHPYEPIGVIKKGMTYVPLADFDKITRGIACEWDANKKQIVAYTEGQKLKLKLGSLKGELNGKPISLRHAPLMHEGKVYLPVREVTELLGIQMKFEKKGNMYTYTLNVKDVSENK